MINKKNESSLNKKERRILPKNVKGRQHSGRNMDHDFKHVKGAAATFIKESFQPGLFSYLTVWGKLDKKKAVYTATPAAAGWAGAVHFFFISIKFISTPSLKFRKF